MPHLAPTIPLLREWDRLAHLRLALRLSPATPLRYPCYVNGIVWRISAIPNAIAPATPLRDNHYANGIVHPLPLRANRITFAKTMPNESTMAFDPSIPEEQLKNEVASTIFFNYDCDRIIGKIDFAVYPHAERNVGQDALAPHVWAEAKRGKGNLDEALVQLLLTIGKARAFDRHNPPKYLAAFNAEGIVFIEYAEVHGVFYQNDFNWNVAPNDHGTREFRQLADLVGETLGNNALRFYWHDATGDNGDWESPAGKAHLIERRVAPPIKSPTSPRHSPRYAPTLPPSTPPRVSPSLSLFIQRNFNAAQTTALLQIDRNNFISIYNRWLEAVKPSIAVDWDKLRKTGIIDGDFYLADIMSQENQTITEKLYVLLQNDRYVLNRQIDDSGLYTSASAIFNDGQKAHNDFWRKYQRPPESVYWDYILDRRDLLVPQDIRERKGSFFTPRQWVELSQQYLADYLGRDWQDEYYVWDCAAGTGNLLAGLANPSMVWASTIDQQDVDVMHQRIENGAALFKNHVFQFDFLNDGWEKLPKGLREIVEDPEKRKRLVVYINPPYAEGDAREGHGRTGVHLSRVHGMYKEELGRAARELFALFLMRINREIPGCTIGSFSTLKLLLAPNFKGFRAQFTAELRALFLCPSDTFDNVNGQFPIAFSIWDTRKFTPFRRIKTQIFDAEGERLGDRVLISYDDKRFISDWLGAEKTSVSDVVGRLASVGNDFQNQIAVYIESKEHKQKRGGRHTLVGVRNLIRVCVYFAVRHCIPMDWLNTSSQFLWPSEQLWDDGEFLADCLAYTLFHRRCRISHSEGVNHWIPYTEGELGLKDGFESHFLTDFMGGQLPVAQEDDTALMTGKEGKELFPTGQTPLVFSPEAQRLLDAGRELWKYYLSKPGVDIDASFYDIRAFFQGRKRDGAVKASSTDGEYTRLYSAIQDARKALGDTKIAPKVYAYGFLVE